MSASSITGAKPHFERGCKLQTFSLRLCPHATRNQGGQVSLHKGANPCTSSPGACALIERAVVQRHTRSEAVHRTATRQQRATTDPTRIRSVVHPGRDHLGINTIKNKKGPVPSGIRALCLQLYQQRLQVTGGFAHMACLRPEGGWGW